MPKRARLLRRALESVLLFRIFANMRCLVQIFASSATLILLASCSPAPYAPNRVAEVRSYSLLKDAIPGNPYASRIASPPPDLLGAFVAEQDPVGDLIAASSASLSDVPPLSYSGDFRVPNPNRERLVSAMRRMDSQFDATKRPRRTPKEWVKRPWDHSLGFLLPDQKAEYSSDYGWRSLWGRKDFHGGIDVMARKGTPVFAITDGWLEYAESAGRNGGLVLKGQGQHAGFHFTYWHIQPSAKLRQGQQVRKGQLLGRIANWGANSHLHYAVHATDGQSYKARKDSRSIHPMLYHRREIVSAD